MMNHTLSLALAILLTTIFLIPAASAGPTPTPWAAHHPSLLPYPRPSPAPHRTPLTTPAPASPDPNITNLLLALNESLILGFEENLTSFGPRVTGTPACDNASHYLYTTFASFGLPVRYHNWTDGALNASNIEATLPGTTSSPVLIICGHYDCVPQGPGADDDGSGVAAVLAAAHLLKDSHFTHTIRFVAFSGEEQGLIGSHYYAQEAAEQGLSIIAVLNADMIAYAETTEDAHTAKVFYDNASEWICNYTDTISTIYHPAINLTIIHMGYIWGSDHNSFWDYGYQAVFYHEFKFNAYYHSANDTIAHMNLTYAAHFSRLILATLAELANQTRPILTITTITGGLGCTATVTNTGDAPAQHVNLTIDISAGYFHLHPKTHTWTAPDSLIPGDFLQHRLVSIGIGPVDITITATEENHTGTQRTASAYELGPFLLTLTPT